MKVIKDNYIRHHSHVQFTYESFKCHIIYVHILSLRLFWWSHLGILFSSSLIFTGDIGWLQIYQWWVFFWQHFFVLCTFNKTWAPITKVSVAGCGDSSLTQTPVLKRQPSMVSFNCCAVAEVNILSDLKSLEEMDLLKPATIKNRKDKRNDTTYRIKVLETGALESWISPKICVTCKIFVLVESNLTCFLGWERNIIFSRLYVEIDLLLSGWSNLLWSGISNSPFLTVITLLHIFSFFFSLSPIFASCISRISVMLI